MKNKFLKDLTVWSLLVGITFQATPVWALEKDEIVYAKLNSNGSVNNVIVSEHLKNLPEGNVYDTSSLSNIKNVNGNEKFSKENGSIVWESNGSDIYYQGTYSDTLPIETEIKYYLNGTEYNVNDMIGKSGSVKIVLKYKNNLKNTVMVNGKVTTLYTPFVVATTSIIPNEDNSNLKVTNGKVIDNGLNNVVVALSTPGLYESLDIDSLKDMDTVVISYDTKYFQLSSIYGVATSKVLEESDLDIFDDVTGLYESIYKLSDSSNQLVAGSIELLKGAEALMNGASALKEGTNEMYNQVNSAKNENALNNSDIEKIQSIAVAGATLSQEQLNMIASSAVSGATLSQAQLDQIAALAMSGATLSQEQLDQISSMAVAGATLSQEQLNQISANAVAAATLSNDTLTYISNNAKNQAVTAIKNSSEYIQYSTAKAQLENAGIANLVGVCTAEVIPDAMKETCLSNYSNIINYVKVSTAVSAMESTASSVASQVSMSVAQQVSATVADQVSKSVADQVSKAVASEVSKTVASQVSQSVANQVSKSVAQQISSNVASEVSKSVANQVSKTVASEVSKTVANQVANSVKNATLDKIAGGLEQLNNGAIAVYDGTVQLYNGISTLSDGLVKFDKEGISKIANLVNGDIKDLQGKTEALIKLSNDYNTLDSLNNGDNGSSKIIISIDSIKKEKERITSDDAIVEKKSFFGKIKGLFK